MPQYGTIKRAKPRVRVLRGYDPNEPRTRTGSFPVGADVVIKSGQVIYSLWNGTDLRYEWALGCVAGAIPYIALQDSADEDVIEADSLVGLSCSGQFEIATGYYGAGTFNQGVYLTYDGVTGNVIPTTAETASPILGVVSRIRGPEDLTGVDSSADTLTVIIFETIFLPNTADAT